MKKTIAMALTALLGASALAGCGGGNSTPTSSGGGSTSSSAGNNAASSSQAPDKTTPTHLAFNSNGTPNLKGMTIKMGMAAGDAHVGDSTIYMLTQYLKKWGANVTFTLGNSNTTALATVAGRLQVDDGTLPQLVDAGAVVFGPAMVHTDYVFVAKGITKLSQLNGKTVGLSISTAPDYVLWQPLLKKAGLTTKQVHHIFTQSSSNTLTAMLTNRLTAGFIHSDGLLKLSKVKNLHVLASAATLAPWMADSFIGANASWIKAHPALAEAVDLAWLYAANTFNTNTQAWVNAAETYTKHADSPARVKAIHDVLAKANPWPTQADSFTKTVVMQNYTHDKSLNQIKGAGLKPASTWLDMTPWQQAFQVWQKNHG